MADKKEQWEIEADKNDKFFKGESDTLTIDVELKKDPYPKPIKKPKD